MRELKEAARRLMKEQKLSGTTIAEMSGVDSHTVYRFLQTGCGNIGTVESIFASLGYELWIERIEGEK